MKPIKPCSKCGANKTQSANGRWRCRPCENIYQREHYKKHPEIKERKRKWMADARLHPDKHSRLIESSRKAYKNGGDEKQKDRLKRMQHEEPMRWKVKLARKLNKNITQDDLINLWNKQHGLCALTGKTINVQDAELDHIVPQSRGGSHEMNNLRWVWNKANQAKGDMLDDEFLELCQQVAEWIGRRIMETI